LQYTFTASVITALALAWNCVYQDKRVLIKTKRTSLFAADNDNHRVVIVADAVNF
jgi:hypothetical protein